LSATRAEDSQGYRHGRDQVRQTLGTGDRRENTGQVRIEKVVVGGVRVDEGPPKCISKPTSRAPLPYLKKGARREQIQDEQQKREQRKGKEEAPKHHVRRRQTKPRHCEKRLPDLKKLVTKKNVKKRTRILCLTGRAKRGTPPGRGCNDQKLKWEKKTNGGKGPPTRKKRPRKGAESETTHFTLRHGKATRSEGHPRK